MNSLDLPGRPEDTRIVVAMSGGVDSSVTAALLKEQGYDVVGVTLQLYDYGGTVRRQGACCAGQDILDARRVAERLGIAHYVLDYESRFRDQVIDDFADSYLRGETPIPCIRCNQTVKFADLLGTARDLGAAALATGHYVRRVAGAGGAELHRALEAERDQSYFLFATTPEQLDFLRFPLGGLPKAEVRRLAGEFALPVAAKPDSQDICFVPEGRYAQVIERLRPGAAEPGEIVDQAGRVLGRHQGILHYTIGQRRGLPGGSGEPLYVLRLEPAARRVVVGPRRALGRGIVHLSACTWLTGEAVPGAEFEAEVKLRSSQSGLPAKVLVAADGRARVSLAAPEFGVAPGQACVAYRGSRVLGGGWIQTAEPVAEGARPAVGEPRTELAAPAD